MGKKFGNSKRNKKLASISEFADLLSGDNNLTCRSKFNFSYLDVNQEPGYSIQDLMPNQLQDLVLKIKEFCQHSLQHLSTMATGGASRSGKRGHILKFYPCFPPNHKTKFREPNHTPTQITWGCFRLSGAARLVGFIVPPELHDRQHSLTRLRFDKNTFYVVFIDMDHQFWLTK